jgi:putative glutamine amidotransferase
VVSRNPVLIGVVGRPIAAGKIGSSAAVGVGVGYLAAVERAGAEPVVIGPRRLETDGARLLLERLDGLLFLGGPDVDPLLYGGTRHATIVGTDVTDDRFEIAMMKAALAADVPTLAICRGIQVLNVALGGTLVPHLPERPGVGSHGRPGTPKGAAMNEVSLVAGSLLAKTMDAERVTCSCHHHQALDRVGEGLRVVAHADDGVIEGVEFDGGWMLAVQWHPEDTAGADPAQQHLFDGLVTEARSRS